MTYFVDDIFQLGLELFFLGMLGEMQQTIRPKIKNISLSVGHHYQGFQNVLK